MMFWGTVAIAYLLILAVGFTLGIHLVRRPPGGGLSPAATPGPSGPTHGVEWSDFDAGFLAATRVALDNSTSVMSP